MQFELHKSLSIYKDHLQAVKASIAERVSSQTQSTVAGDDVIECYQGPVLDISASRTNCHEKNPMQTIHILEGHITNCSRTNMLFIESLESY